MLHSEKRDFLSAVKLVIIFEHSHDSTTKIQVAYYKLISERQMMIEILIPSTAEIDRFKKVLLDGTDEEAADAFRNLSPAVKAFFEQCLPVRVIKQFSQGRFWKGALGYSR